MNFKLGIVSSFDTLCGNATYSLALLNGFPKHIEPVKIEVPTKLQKFHNLKTEKSIIEKVTRCDAINIQMELGLYGPTPEHSIRFLKKIIKSSKRVSLTMHRIEPFPANLIKTIYNHLKAKNFVKAIKAIAIKNVYSKYVELIKFAEKNNSTFIVHTYREKERILDISPNATVFIHPIIWPENYCLNRIIQENLENKYQHIFRNKDPIIGLFGFMSDYKNFLQVVRVVLTEKKHNLLLAGGVHPESPDYGQHISIPNSNQNANSEFEAISNIFMKLPEDQKARINYIHSPEDHELIQLFKFVDIVVIPYTEVGQSASGIASLALQFGKRVLFSDTKTSRELSKFLIKKPFFFDTKSDLSLAKTLEQVAKQEEYSITFDEYTFDTNIKTYLNSLNIT